MPRKRKQDNENRLAVRIGTNLRIGRARLGLTQGQLAERIDVEVETISRIETGAQLPSLARLEQIGLALDLPVAALLFDPETTRETAELLAGVMVDLPAREREFIYTYVLAYAKHWKAGQRRS